MKRSRLAQLGIIGTILTCAACLTPVAVILLGGIGLAMSAGYQDYILFLLLAVCVVVLMVGLIQSLRGRKRMERT